MLQAEDGRWVPPCSGRQRGPRRRRCGLGDRRRACSRTRIKAAALDRGAELLAAALPGLAADPGPGPGPSHGPSAGTNPGPGPAPRNALRHALAVARRALHWLVDLIMEEGCYVFWLLYVISEWIDGLPFPLRWIASTLLIISSSAITFSCFYELFTSGGDRYIVNPIIAEFDFPQMEEHHYNTFALCKYLFVGTLLYNYVKYIFESKNKLVASMDRLEEEAANGVGEERLDAAVPRPDDTPYIRYVRELIAIRRLHNRGEFDLDVLPEVDAPTMAEPTEEENLLVQEAFELEAVKKLNDPRILREFIRRRESRMSRKRLHTKVKDPRKRVRKLKLESRLNAIPEEGSVSQSDSSKDSKETARERRTKAALEADVGKGDAEKRKPMIPWYPTGTAKRTPSRPSSGDAVKSVAELVIKQSTAAMLGPRPSTPARPRMRTPSPQPPFSPCGKRPLIPAQPFSPTNSRPGSPTKPYTPPGSRPGSPDYMPYRSRPLTPSSAYSPTGSRPLTPSSAYSPTGSRPLTPSSAYSPTGSRPLTPSSAYSPTGSRPLTPSSAYSPTGSRPGSPTKAYTPTNSRPGSPTKPYTPPGSRPGSPVYMPFRSRPLTPSSTYSQTGSRPGSPTTPNSSTNSRPASPTKPHLPINSRPGSPTKQFSPRDSRPGSPASPCSPTGSRPNTPLSSHGRSRMRPGARTPTPPPPFSPSKVPPGIRPISPICPSRVRSGTRPASPAVPTGPRSAARPETRVSPLRPCSKRPITPTGAYGRRDVSGSPLTTPPPLPCNLRGRPTSAASKPAVSPSASTTSAAPRARSEGGGRGGASGDAARARGRQRSRPKPKVEPPPPINWNSLSQTMIPCEPPPIETAVCLREEEELRLWGPGREGETSNDSPEERPSPPTNESDFESTRGYDRKRVLDLIRDLESVIYPDSQQYPDEERDPLPEGCHDREKSPYVQTDSDKECAASLDSDTEQECSPAPFTSTDREYILEQDTDSDRQCSPVQESDTQQECSSKSKTYPEERGPELEKGHDRESGSDQQKAADQPRGPDRQSGPGRQRFPDRQRDKRPIRQSSFDRQGGSGRQCGSARQRGSDRQRYPSRDTPPNRELALVNDASEDDSTRAHPATDTECTDIDIPDDLDHWSEDEASEEDTDPELWLTGGRNSTELCRRYTRSQMQRSRQRWSSSRSSLSGESESSATAGSDFSRSTDSTLMATCTDDEATR